MLALSSLLCTYPRRRLCPFRYPSLPTYDTSQDKAQNSHVDRLLKMEVYQEEFDSLQYLAGDHSTILIKQWILDRELRESEGENYKYPARMLRSEIEFQRKTLDPIKCRSVWFIVQQPEKATALEHSCSRWTSFEDSILRPPPKSVGCAHSFCWRRSEFWSTRRPAVAHARRNPLLRRRHWSLRTQSSLEDQLKATDFRTHCALYILCSATN